MKFLNPVPGKKYHSKEKLLNKRMPGWKEMVVTKAQTIITKGLRLVKDTRYKIKLRLRSHKMRNKHSNRRVSLHHHQRQHLTILIQSYDKKAFSYIYKMEEEIINGFKWVSILGNKMLVIESGRLQECLNYASSECVKAIYISNYNGYYLTDLEFLHQHNWFTEVMSSGDSRNISAIHALKNLRKLNINNEKQEIDLTRFSSLEDCSVDWNNKIKGLNTVNNLQHLKLWKFKPSSKDFTALTGCMQVRTLKVTESNIESFEGIEALPALDHFEGYYLPKLKQLNGLEILAAQLTTLILENSKKLTNYDATLRQLTNLEKLILSDCAPLATINFIQSLPKLSFFSFVGTNILDSDISPADNLGYAGFDNKRHYNRKFENMKNPLRKY